jgi:HipA-like protein
VRRIKVVNESLKDKKQRLVGYLRFDNNLWIFEYDEDWRKSKTSIELGFDLPFSKKTHKSKELFESFSERIPSTDNGAYSDYCKMWRIPVTEKDMFVLLSTLGHRGPSTLLFFPDGFLPGIWAHEE